MNGTMETVKSGVDLSGEEQHLLSLQEQLFHGSRTQQAFEAERLSTVNTSNKCSSGGAAQNTVQVLVYWTVQDKVGVVLSEHVQPNSCREVD